ncbi:hypothetical protein BH09PLA1_BH09PLA1_20450 [soil metagenome]
MVIGYSTAGRTFAYIGVWQLKIFLGEVVLAVFLWRKNRAFDWFFVRARRNRYVEVLRAALIIFILYGVVSILVGYYNQPKNMLQAFQNFAFNYYSLYLVIGVWIAANYRLDMRKTAMIFGWVHGLYGAAWVLILNKFSIEMPGTPGVELFGQPTGAAIALIAMIAFEPRIAKIAFPALLNLFVMAGVQVRSEWMGFIVAFAAWSVLARKFSRFAIIVGIVAMLVGVGLFFDVRLPGTAGRGGEVSVQGIVGRLIAPFDPHLAAKYVDDAEGLGGTADWRKKWWEAIWKNNNEGPAIRRFLGEGYGFAITDVVDFVGDSGIRTPHNIFFYALGYGGWCGIAVFVGFQGTLLWCLWRAYKLTGQPFGVVFWGLALIMALLGNQLETPFGAIPFYLLVGMSLKPLFTPHEMWEDHRAPKQARQFFQPVTPVPFREASGYRDRLNMRR